MANDNRGQLFLGHEIEAASGDKTGQDVLFDARDLTTHGVIVGMTGSGKTGLGIIAIEEALLSGIPALVLDPKGDMGNLFLNFPDLRPEDFRPWINEGEAERKELTPDQYAAKTAELWRNGLSGSGITPDRMRRLKQGAAITLYTPGSTAGVPLNVVGSLRAPTISWQGNEEVLRDEIEGFVSSLLTLAGIDSDPISSREHILLANIIEKSWIEGRDLDLATLIGQVQQPPMRKLGVFDLDSFFPEKDRTALAMRLNGLIASPSFATWMEGADLDVASLLHAPDGRPRAAIIHLAHLSDEERQFVVTLLLSKVVTWMRGLTGTTDLRTLIYMDEVFGFAPPTANPPSKKPILTILKQARAYGVGMLLSTQNPVDLDYKAMSNAGTWFVGRLQTERDKARVVEGMASARGDVDVDFMSNTISGLGKRQFVLHSTHIKAPLVFATRWAISYLRGPLTREQIQVLAKDAPERRAGPTGESSVSTEATYADDAGTEARTGAAAAARQARSTPALADDESMVMPKISSSVPVRYLHPAAPWSTEVGADRDARRLQAALVARVHLVFDDRAAGVDHTEEWEAVFFPLTYPFDAASGKAVDYDARDFLDEPPAGAVYVLPVAPLAKSTYFTAAKRDIQDYLYRNREIEVLRNPSLKLYSRVGEPRDDFEERCDAVAQDKADEETAKLRDRYEGKIKRANEALRKAELRLEELEATYDARRHDEMISGVGDIVGSLFGGRRGSRGIAGMLKRGSSRRSRTQLTGAKVSAAEERVESRVADIEDLEQELAEKVAEIDAKWRDRAMDIETVEIGLEKSDIDVDELALVWVPTR
jgi:hypothetical protein